MILQLDVILLHVAIPEQIPRFLHGTPSADDFRDVHQVVLDEVLLNLDQLEPIVCLAMVIDLTRLILEAGHLERLDGLVPLICIGLADLASFLHLYVDRLVGILVFVYVHDILAELERGLLYLLRFDEHLTSLIDL